jgi:hypothetical protein
MNDHFEQLFEDPEFAAAWTSLATTKTAGVRDVAKGLYNLGARIGSVYKPELAGALVGAAVMGAAGYAANKRWGGKASLAENDSKEMALAERRTQARQKEAPGFSRKLRTFMTTSNQRLSKLMSDHPRAAAGVLAATGMAAGARTGRMISNLQSKVPLITG